MSRPPVIQINSLEALQRLIGGDSELELQLRQSVAVAFANRYLKPLADNPLFQDACRSTKEAINSAFKTLVAEQGGSLVKNAWTDHLTVNLPKDVKLAIANEIRDQIRVFLPQMIKETVQQEIINVGKDIRAKVKAELTEAVVDEIKLKVQKAVST